MTKTKFVEMLHTEGYEGPIDFSMEPNEVDTEHAHEEDTVALVVEGSIAIEKPSGDATLNVGDTVSYPAGEPTSRRPARMESKHWSAGETLLISKSHNKRMQPDTLLLAPLAECAADVRR